MMQMVVDAGASFVWRISFAVAAGSLSSAAWAQPADVPAAPAPMRSPGSRTSPATPPQRIDTLTLAWGNRPVPDSNWVRNDRAHFATIANGAYDILVAPVASSGLGLNRTTRSLVQAKLAALLAERGLKVVNPYVTQRALGE